MFPVSQPREVDYVQQYYQVTYRFLPLRLSIWQYFYNSIRNFYVLFRLGILEKIQLCLVIRYLA